MIRSLPLILIFAMPLAAQSQSLGPPVDGLAKPRAESAQHWTEQLAAGDFRDRWYAAYMLGTLGPDAAAAVPTLHKVLEKKAEHEYVRGMAAWASVASVRLPSPRFRCWPIRCTRAGTWPSAARRWNRWAISARRQSR